MLFAYHLLHQGHKLVQFICFKMNFNLKSSTTTTKNSLFFSLSKEKKLMCSIKMKTILLWIRNQKLNKLRLSYKLMNQIMAKWWNRLIKKIANDCCRRFCTFQFTIQSYLFENFLEISLRNNKRIYENDYLVRTMTVLCFFLFFALFTLTIRIFYYIVC